jgi:hypothetical protein
VSTERGLAVVGGVGEPGPVGGEVAGDGAVFADGPVLAVELVHHVL